MADAVYLPKVGMTMEEGSLERWLVPDGAEVRRGQPIFELETEKVNMEVEADGDGLLRQLVGEGAKLKPGDVVGCLLAPGEELPAALLAAVAAQQQTSSAAQQGRAAATVPGHAAAAPAPPLSEATQPPRATPIARRLAQEHGIDLSAVRGSGPDGRILEKDVAAALQARPEAEAAAATVAPAAEQAAAAGPVRVSPIARRLAAEHGIDPATLTGSGPDGRVVERDVQTALEARAAAAPPAAGAAGAAAAGEETVAYSGRRRTIGERMLHSLQSMAQVTLVGEAAVDDALSMLHGLNREWRRDGVVVTLTALIVRACALALAEQPRLNARLDGDRIAVSPRVNVGVAVDVEEGLIVPVIRDAERASLKEVAALLRGLTEKAKAGSLSLDDVSCGTFTVSSLDSTRVDAFTPVINPPQAAILGVGRVREVAAFEDGSVVRRRVTTLSLTFDHRISDGYAAARFLDRVAELLERPYLLM